MGNSAKGGLSMRVRVTGRFYLLLLLIALIILFLFRGQIFGTNEVAVIYRGSAQDSRTVQGVIVRDEMLVSENLVTRMEFAVNELGSVNEGDTVAYVYSLEYSTRLINELNQTRKNIQTYHKIVLGNELDAQLEVLNLNVQQRAEELKSLVSGQTRGSMPQMVQLLTEAMEARRAYMSANKRSDSKLIKYYDDEKQRLTAIEGWRIAKSAPTSGLVSFYLDGYEAALNAQTVPQLEISDVRTVLEGGALETPTAARSQRNLCRVLKESHWYMLLTGDDREWNPTLDTTYSFIVNGFDEMVYEGVVTKVLKNGTTVMAVLEVNQPIGSLAYTRSGEVTIGANMNGLKVSRKALATVSGQTGVWLYDVPGGTFVPVEVLTYQSDGSVLFTPLVDGVLTEGTQVLIK